ncbi:cysteine proteinase [Fragilariopsis cylindrus CCMP1102]|uniref:Ubiquitin carboxyl-terminal hydrolase n=1 Tax=Fragilariopsis cylindrus CCMP1102 TaxID=635003 RepID=A0A1E7FCK2_9STRA|nr:cysteine proteinase [Fragilariopsis cylindrus CCMP1102]|eukprot:OEU15864.1 cysteine proteinase [Fragilariopsis cylindrus CCMP1102]
MGKGDSAPTSPTKPAQAVQTAANEAKNKVQAQVKKAVQDTTENTKVCTIPGFGACGLVNLGNTCYINSALQCISYFPLLRSYLLSGEYKTTGDLNKDNPLGTEGWLLEEFVELLRFMWSSKAGEKSPTRLRQVIAKLKPDVFAGADQQDAQELLSYVLDALMEDSNRVRKKPYVEGLEDDWVKNNGLYRVGEEAWRRERRRSRSIVTDVITGQTLSTTTCPVCNYSSQKFDPFNLLSVPLPTKTQSASGSAGMPLGKCLTEFCKIQKLENDEGDTHWRCPRCKDFRPGAKQNLVLWRLPDILTIHMKRFRSSQKWREKITTKVNFPLTGLDMKEWCHKESPVVHQTESGESYVYDLIGVLNHYGGMTGGHYVATCKATPSAMAKAQRESAEPLWLQFDDEVVEPIAPKSVISESAYVLFYRRRRLTPANVARYSSLE